LQENIGICFLALVLIMDDSEGKIRTNLKPRSSPHSHSENASDNLVDKTKDTQMTRFKPIKRPSAETDNHLVNILDFMLNGLEQSMGKRTYLCGNRDCGTLILFHSNEPRPIVCTRYGSEIDWEGEYIIRIKFCPKCEKEYDINANYCAYHTPLVSLVEREVEKQS
jgi:hypothetical protein